VNEQPTLQTERLVLRPLTLQDAPTLSRLAGRREIADTTITILSSDTTEATVVGTATIKTGKEAFYRQLEMPLDQAYAYASQVMTENMLDAEACEGIGAFIEKREPKWLS